ncbi:unnamed protein product [Nippostrongylus brasiliensis]|uniref:CCHC-type domain-containing protein n=1 Tax=Nippostrongylus brasiliensis TaxID=27835 RepID=A0A0N4XDU5_NIPBR|nr:unnamed protein product [Nippostrongylus brasiliensis]
MEHESNNEELRRLRERHDKLMKALPRLPEPPQLIQKIVEACRETMYYCAILDQIHDDIPQISQSKHNWAELERDAQILEYRAENCEIRFLYLRQTLRTLYAIPPILIATSKISKRSWDHMMHIPQSYYDNEGRQHKLVIEQDTVETIIADQLTAVKDLFTTLRNLRTSLLNEERAQKTSWDQKIEQSVSALGHSVSTLSEKLEDIAKNCIEMKNAIPTKVVNEQPVPMEVEASGGIGNEPNEAEHDTLNFNKRTLVAKIHILEVRIAAMKEDQPCRPREFHEGMARSTEARMRCVFCGSRGRHYSDSCPRIRDGRRRKIKLQDENRCPMCLEIGCISDQKCPKYWVKCFHCGRMGHHSAICEAPDKAQEIQEQIVEASREIAATKEKIRAINKKLGIQEDP